MFGFGNSRRTLRDNDIFDVPDVQELVQTFPQKISSGDEFNPDPSELMMLVSGEGFIVRSFVTQLLENELEKKDGRLNVANLAASLNVAPEDLLRIFRDDQTAFFSKARSSILTRPELKNILEQLQSRADKMFVPATQFANELDMDPKDLIRLAEMSDDLVQEGPLQLLQNPRASPPSLGSTSYPYIHTLSLLLKTKKSLMEKMTSAQAEAKPTSWNFSEMTGLSKDAFSRLAQSLFPPTEKTDAIEGDFESVEDGVRFVPHSYILRKVKHHAKEVARGDKVYCDLENLSKLYPKLLPNVSSAQEFVETVAHERDGASAEFHVVSHYAIGNSSLNSNARTILEKLSDDRFTNTKPYLKNFPREIDDEVRALLHNQTISYYCENGANREDILSHGDWLILAALITDLASAATRLGKTAANEQWQIQSENPVHLTILSPPIFLERFHKESELPLELLRHLWAIQGSGSESISVAAMTAFEKRIAELQQENQDLFMSLWTSRAVLKSYLYNAGLQALPTSPLKDQLSELRSAHLLEDLIPNTIKRARTKGLVRTANLSRQISKLETEIAPTKDVRKSSPQDSISKFAKKMSIGTPSSNQLTTAKKEHIEDMVAAMNKDKDGPRLFLSLVIVLCASRKEGIIYATGKFAPKLLKVIKEDLDEGLYKRLEEIKELVKLGKVDKTVRVEMRELAAKVVRDMVGENGESEM
ncbi:hypothetical protein E6O75_ATG08299 [Venturia nashicola]|uniref:Uncharacterized protein n=1 Tax=Venturia nashicola TaxID=86259 RepID=A0A4Z1P9T0_9PEZI|nr:hypothetical protein E6O75_ATG08299 [Venturia nashicola]